MSSQNHGAKTLDELREGLCDWFRSTSEERQLREIYWCWVMTDEEREAFRKSHLCTQAAEEQCSPDRCNKAGKLCDEVFADGHYVPRPS